MGLTWGLYFNSVGNWPLVAMDLTMMAAGLCSAAMGMLYGCCM